MPRRRPRPDRAGRHPGRDAAQLHRLRDVGHRRPCAARRAGRPQAGAHPRAVRHVRRRLPARPGLLQVRPRRRRGHGQLPPARRQRDLRRAGAAGPAVVDADAAGRRPGQLRLAGQRPARGHAVHRVPAGAAGHGDAAGHRQGHRRFPARTTTGAPASPSCCPPGSPTCWSTAPRGSRSAWPPRSRRTTCARSPRASQWYLEQLRRHRRGAARRADRADQGPGLPHPRPDRRPPRHRGRLPDRPRLDHHARGGRGRGGRPRPHLPGRHRAALPGQPGQPGASRSPSWSRTAGSAGSPTCATRPAAGPASGW